MRTRDIKDVVSSFTNEQIDIIREAGNHEDITEKEFELLSNPSYTRGQMQALYDLILVNNSDGLSKYNRLKFKYLDSIMENDMDEFQLRAIAKYITNRHFDKKEFAKVNQPSLSGAQIIFIYSLFNLIDKNAINKKKKGTDPEYDIFSRLHKKKVNKLISDISTYPEIYDVIRLDTTIQMLSDGQIKNSYVEKFIYDEECDAESFHVSLMYKYYHLINLNKPSFENLFLITDDYLRFNEEQLLVILRAYSKDVDAKNFEHIVSPDFSADVMDTEIRAILQNQILKNDTSVEDERKKKEARIREIEAEKERLIAEVVAKNKEELTKHNEQAIHEIKKHAEEQRNVNASDKQDETTNETVVDKAQENVATEDVATKEAIKTETKVEVKVEQIAKVENESKDAPQLVENDTVEKKEELNDTTNVSNTNNDVVVFVDDVVKMMEKEERKKAHAAKKAAIAQIDALLEKNLKAMGAASVTDDTQVINSVNATDISDLDHYDNK